MDIKELLERYSEGERNFEGLNLSGVTIKGYDLTGINLKGAILSKSSLEKVTLDNANLTQCNFSEAILNTVDFWDADLSDADFSIASLIRVDFKGAILNRTNFFSLKGIDNNCKLEGAKITDVSFKKSHLTYKDFSKLNWEGCDFSEANLENAKFTSSNCKNCNFNKALLKESIFRDTALESANFAQANLQKANLMRAKVKNANFIGANLTDANLYASNYEEAKIVGAIMPDGEVYDPEGYFVFESTPKSSQLQFIDTENAPKSPNSPHQAVIVNGCLYVAGQIAIDPRVNAMLCEDEITEQTRRVMENLTAILTTAGAGWTDVVKTTIFMIDLNECDRMNSVYSEYFPDGNLPICTCVAVSHLPQNVRIQIECVATV